MNHSKPPNSAIIRSLPFEKSAKAEEAGADSSLYVVQYSRVALLAHDPLQLAVQPYNFEAQIEYLAENYYHSATYSQFTRYTGLQFVEIDAKRFEFLQGCFPMG